MTVSFMAVFNEILSITCGIFYCRDSAEINGCGSLQTLLWLDSNVLRNRQQKHTAVRWRSLEQTKQQTFKH
jgi:hypothetical protein